MRSRVTPKRSAISSNVFGFRSSSPKRIASILLSRASSVARTPSCSGSDLVIIANTYTNVLGSGTVANAWTFSDPNYQSASGSATVSITPAAALLVETILRAASSS